MPGMPEIPEIPVRGRVGAAIAALVVATVTVTVTGCSSHHPGSTATTLPTSTIPPTVAPSGPNGARALAATAGCTHFDPLPINGTVQQLGAASAGTCTLGSDTVLFATTADASDIPRALRDAAQLGAVEGVTVYAAVGPNWVAAGSSSPTKALATEIVAKLGGRVEQATAPSAANGAATGSP